MLADADYDDFVGRLLASVPELEARFQEHLASSGELLPHVFFADYVAPFMLALVEGDDAAGIVRRTLDALEEILANSSDERVSEAVSLSFLAPLYRSPQFAALQVLMGPNLIREAELNKGYG